MSVSTGFTAIMVGITAGMLLVVGYVHLVDWWSRRRNLLGLAREFGYEARWFESNESIRRGTGEWWKVLARGGTVDSVLRYTRMVSGVRGARVEPAGPGAFAVVVRKAWWARWARVSAGVAEAVRRHQPVGVAVHVRRA